MNEYQKSHAEAFQMLQGHPASLNMTSPGRSIIVAGAKDSFMSFGLYDTLSIVKLLTALH